MKLILKTFYSFAEKNWKGYKISKLVSDEKNKTEYIKTNV